MLGAGICPVAFPEGFCLHSRRQCPGSLQFGQGPGGGLSDHDEVAHGGPKAAGICCWVGRLAVFPAHGG